MRRRGDVMWRNFGWTAILATWTIFLILNSGLAGERILNKPQNNNEDTPYKVHSGIAFSVLNKKVIDDSRLQHTRENFKSNDRSSMHVKAVSLEFKNTENRDSRLSGYEKHFAMTNAMATTKYLKDSNKSARLITKRTGNIWLSKVIVMEKSKNTRNYRKFISSLRPSPPISQELKSASRKRRRKENTIYVFLNDRKKTGMIRRDTQAYDKKGGLLKKHEGDRIFSEENEMTAFFPDKFTKMRFLRSGKDGSIQKFKNSDISQLKMQDIESRHINGTHKHRNEKDSLQSPELTKNSMNKLIYVTASDKSQGIEPTFSNYSSLKKNQSHENKTITTATDNTITETSPYQRDIDVTWTTLIFNSKISSANGEVDDKENTVSPYHFSEDEYSKSFKADKLLAAKTYKRNEYSKVGFKVSTDTHGDKKRNENIIDSFTFRASNLLNNHFTRKRVSFTKQPFLYKKKNALKASDIFDQRHQYHSSTSDTGGRINRKTVNFGEVHTRIKTEEKKITAFANYAAHNTLKIESALLPSNLSTKRIDQSNLDYQMPARISVTQKRNPMHVRHVGLNADCERSQRTEFETKIRDAFRFGLRNVSGPSRIAKFDSFVDQKPHRRSQYSQKFHAINIGTRPPRIAETTDGRSELDEEPRRTGSVSIFLDAANVSDNSTGMRKINGRVQSSSKLTDEPGLENVKVMTRRRGSHRDMHERSGFYSRSDDVHNSKYRRYKRHEHQNTPRISTSTEVDSETWKTLNTARATTTSNLLIEFTANPSISTTQTNNVDQISTNTKKVLTSVKTLPSSKYRKFQKEWQSIPLTTDHDEKYTNASVKVGSDASDSLDISLIDAPKTLNASLVETPFLIKAHDQSRAITKIDNSIISKELPSAVEANVRVPNAMNTPVFEVSSTELINSQEGHGTYGNESVWTIDPFPQRNSDPSRGVFESITTENIIDSSASDVPSDQWPVKHSAVVEGDLVLGGLMMVHEREDRITCGRVMPQGGIQALEAMLYTLDTLNDREIVPGVKIGAHILDDCDKDTYGLEMAVDFIKGTYTSQCWSIPSLYMLHTISYSYI